MEHGYSMVKKNDLSDEELALKASSDKAAAAELAARYLLSVEIMANRLAPNVDREQTKNDLVQEGFMALLRAVRSYSADRGSGFSAYVAVCVKNGMLKFLQKNNRSFAVDVTDEEFERLLGADIEAVPERIVLEKERMEELYRMIDGALSECERQVLGLVLEGLSYEQTGQKLGMSAKQVNNAMQRVRKKLRVLLGE